MKAGLLAVVLILAGCAGKPPPDAPSDATLQRELNAGRSALALERPAQAVASYRAALVRAEMRDDLTAIQDAGFNLAVAQLRAGADADALATARAVRAELARRGGTPSPALDLAEATALYRVGDWRAAQRLAVGVWGSSDAVATVRATFLLGLIADGNADLAGLRGARAALPGAGADEAGADAGELDARMHLRAKEWRAARDAAEKTATTRRDLLDYRGLARALGLAAAAAAELGDRDAAADLYLRAGRSAASQNDGKAARNWLGRAIGFTRDPDVLRKARAALAELTDREKK